MPKIILTGFVLSLLLLFAPTDVQSGGKNQANSENGSGTLQKRMVASGSATTEIDLHGLDGTSSRTEELKSTSSHVLSALQLVLNELPTSVIMPALKGEAGL